MSSKWKIFSFCSGGRLLARYCMAVVFPTPEAPVIAMIIGCLLRARNCCVFGREAASLLSPIIDYRDILYVGTHQLDKGLVVGVGKVCLPILLGQKGDQKAMSQAFV